MTRSQAVRKAERLSQELDRPFLVFYSNISMLTRPRHQRYNCTFLGNRVFHDGIIVGDVIEVAYVFATTQKLFTWGTFRRRLFA